jgi:hypothetical protein
MLVTVKDISLAAKRTPRCIRGTITRLGWESANISGVYLVRSESIPEPLRSVAEANAAAREAEAQRIKDERQAKKHRKNWLRYHADKTEADWYAMARRPDGTLCDSERVAPLIALAKVGRAAKEARKKVHADAQKAKLAARSLAVVTESIAARCHPGTEAAGGPVVSSAPRRPSHKKKRKPSTSAPSN